MKEPAHPQPVEGQEPHIQAVEDKPGFTPHYRTDLRPPQVQFGRCCITGDWGTVIAIDLGNISVEAPNVDEGVVYDPETGGVIFTKWNPVEFEQAALFSEQGLSMLLEFMRGKASPIPGVTPNLVYMWRVMYTDGSVLPQFEFDSANMRQIERHGGHIEWGRVAQVSLVSRGASELYLSTYTYVAESGLFFKDGSPIDVDYAGVRPEGSQPFYARKNTITFGSVMEAGSLARNVTPIHTTVLQLLGWASPEGKRCIIGVDERGNWRPYDYAE